MLRCLITSPVAEAEKPCTRCFWLDCSWISPVLGSVCSALDLVSWNTEAVRPTPFQLTLAPASMVSLLSGLSADCAAEEIGEVEPTTEVPIGVAALAQET